MRERESRPFRCKFTIYPTRSPIPVTVKSAWKSCGRVLDVVHGSCACTRHHCNAHNHSHCSWQAQWWRSFWNMYLGQSLQSFVEESRRTSNVLGKVDKGNRGALDIADVVEISGNSFLFECFHAVIWFQSECLISRGNSLRLFKLDQLGVDVSVPPFKDRLMMTNDFT